MVGAPIDARDRLDHVVRLGHRRDPDRRQSGRPRNLRQSTTRAFEQRRRAGRGRAVIVSSGGFVCQRNRDEDRLTEHDRRDVDAESNTADHLATGFDAAGWHDTSAATSVVGHLVQSAPARALQQSAAVRPDVAPCV